MKILVTGGAGFIGSHLVEYHLDLGDEVVAVDNCLTGTEENIKSFLPNPKFTFHKTSFLEWDEKKDVLPNVDMIYNMAAIVGIQNVLDHPIETLEVNSEICKQIFQTVSKLEKKPNIFVASTSEVYGGQSGSLSEKQPLKLESVNKGEMTYPVSKIQNELCAKSYSKSFAVPCVIARLFNTIGPRQSGFYGMVLPHFVEQAVHNKPITVFGSGEQVRSFCNVGDTVRILAQLMQCPKAQGRIVNVGDDRAISINKLAQLVKKLADATSEITHVPFEEAYHNSNEYVQIKYRKPALDRLKSFIDVKYNWTLEESIKDLINRKRILEGSIRDLTSRKRR